MSDEQQIISHLIDLKAGQADLSARMTGLEKAVLGDGQPGLMQKLEDLEASKNRMWGIGTALAFLGGVAEWFFHRK